MEGFFSSQRQFSDQSASALGHALTLDQQLLRRRDRGEPGKACGHKTNALRLHGCVVQPLKRTETRDGAGNLLTCIKCGQKECTVTTRA